jgi:hypothetical protein
MREMFDPAVKATKHGEITVQLTTEVQRICVKDRVVLPDSVFALQAVSSVLCPKTFM